MRKKLLAILFILGFTVNAYAAREYAQRYPTGTALEVYTPNNLPPAEVETDPLSLHLDCGNDPLTADLDVWGNLSSYDATHNKYTRIYHDGTSANLSTNIGSISILAPGTSDISLRIGDTAGVNKVYIKDSGNNAVASIDSNGVIEGINVTSGIDPGHTHTAGSITEADPLAALLAGRAGGQTLKGGTQTGDDLSFWTNATGTVGSYFFTDLTDNGFVKTSGGTGLLSIDTNTYLTSEVDGSITNELPIAGNLIDISGTPASTVDVDLTEAGDLTWGSGLAATMVHTYNLSGTDVTVTFGSNSVTFSGDLEVTGDLYVNDIFIDNYLATALTVGANGVGGTEGIITLDNGANPGTTATLSYTKWADLEAVNGLVKCNGSGDYSTASAGTDYLAPNGSAAALTSFPTFNQDTTGKSAKTDALNSATTVVNVSSATAPIAGQVLMATANNSATWQNITGTIGITIDGGGSAITTGSKGFTYIPFACTIQSATLLGDVSGSIVIDIKKCSYGSFPTTSSITASAKPTLSSAQNSQDTTLTGWTTSVSSGDVLEFVVDSCTTTTRANLILKVAK